MPYEVEVTGKGFQFASLHKKEADADRAVESHRKAGLTAEKRFFEWGEKHPEVSLADLPEDSSRAL